MCWCGWKGPVCPETPLSLSTQLRLRLLPLPAALPSALVTLQQWRLPGLFTGLGTLTSTHPTEGKVLLFYNIHHNTCNYIFKLRTCSRLLKTYLLKSFWRPEAPLHKLPGRCERGCRARWKGGVFSSELFSPLLSPCHHFCFAPPFALSST